MTFERPFWTCSSASISNSNRNRLNPNKNLILGTLPLNHKSKIQQQRPTIINALNLSSTPTYSAAYSTVIEENPQRNSTAEFYEDLDFTPKSNGPALLFDKPKQVYLISRQGKIWHL